MSKQCYRHFVPGMSYNVFICVLVTASHDARCTVDLLSWCAIFRSSSHNLLEDQVPTGEIYCHGDFSSHQMSCKNFTTRQAPVPLMVFRSNSKFDLVQNIFNQSQQNFAHVTTVTLSWRIQNFVVIDRVSFKPEHCKFWSNFEFDRNIVSGTGARSPG